MTHTEPKWRSTNYTGKRELTPKEKAARRRINADYIFDTGDYYAKD